MKHQTDDGWEDWDYWSTVASQVLREEKKQADWLAWLRFRAELLGPFDESTGDFER
jgi:hypothetical protein